MGAGRRLLIAGTLAVLAAAAWGAARAPDNARAGLAWHQPTPSAPRLASARKASTAVAREPAAPALAESRAEPTRDVEVVLSEPPASTYLAAPANETDHHYDALVRELSRGRATYDRHLGRAARELVVQASESAAESPADARDFLVAGSGAIAGDTVFQHLRTTTDDEASLRKAIAAVLQEPPSGSGPLRVGVGEVWNPAERLPRHVGVLGTRMPVELAPFPATAALGGTWSMRGRLLETWSDLQALVLWPDGRFDHGRFERSGDRIAVEVDVGAHVGALEMQLVGTGPDGPGKVVQVRVYVGQAPPRRLIARQAPDEGHLTSADEAARWAFDLLNRDRVAHGVPLLRWDDGLAAVARNHSVDMRDRGFFGHRSPTTGLHVQRLEAANYRAVASAENLAHNTSIWEAELGLLHSLGHRRNLLDPDLTHVGLGVAGEEQDGGRRRWWLTQLFSRPVIDIDESVEAARLHSEIERQRSEKGLPRLDPDLSLDAVARLAAERVLEGELEGASAQALDAARDRGLLRGRLRAWAASLPELRRLQLPDIVTAPEGRRLGLHVVQDHGTRAGQIAVVVLVGD